MIIEKIEIKNFKSHLNSEIQFNPGITLIIGENGAGKSTILEAISFALYKQHSSSKLSDLIRTNNNNQVYNTMEVSLIFISNGNHYKIIRTRDKSKSASTLYSLYLNEDNTYKIKDILCEGDKNVNKEIERILQMDADLFLNAIYVRQGEIAELISKTPSQKKKLIAKLLGIDSLEKSWNNIKQFISNYENLESEYKGKLSKKEFNYNELKEKQLISQNLNTEITKIQEELNQINTIYSDLKVEKDKLQDNKDKYFNLKNQIDVSLTEIDLLKEEKSELQSQLDDIRKNEIEIRRLEKYVDKLPVYKEYREACLNLMEITKKKQDLIKQKENFIEQNNILSENEIIYNDYIRLENIINELKEDKSNIESELKVYDKIIKDKNSIEKEYNKELHNLNNFKQKLKENLSEYHQDLEEDYALTNVSKFISEFIKNLEAKVIEIEDSISNKKSQNSKFTEIIAQNEKPLKDLESVGDKCPICQSNISNQKKLDLKKLYKESIYDSTNIINQNKEDIKNLESDKIIIKDKISNLINIEKDVSSHLYLIDKIEELKNKLDLINKEIDNFNVNTDDFNNLTEKIQIETDRRNLSKEGYNKYIKAKGAMELITPLNEIDNTLKLLENDQDHEVKIIKIAISKDSSLNQDMDIDEINGKINDLENKVSNYNLLQGTVKNKTNIESKLLFKKESLEEKHQHLLKYEEALKSFNYNEDKYNSLAIQIINIEDKVLNLSNTKSRLEGELKSINENITLLQNQEDEYKLMEIEYKNVSDYKLFLEKIRNLFSKDGLQEDLRKLSRPTIQKYTKDFFEEFNFDYSSLILDDDFNVTLYGPEGESSLNMVSGGEKIAIALALRLGITKAMSSGTIETILLDEPTIHLDSYRRGELIALLRKMSSLPQMIIVTHDEELENAADNIIKVNKNNGISSVVDEADK